MCIINRFHTVRRINRRLRNLQCYVEKSKFGFGVKFFSLVPIMGFFSLLNTYCTHIEFPTCAQSPWTRGPWLHHGVPAPSPASPASSGTPRCTSRGSWQTARHTSIWRWRWPRRLVWPKRWGCGMPWSWACWICTCARKGARSRRQLQLCSCAYMT